MFYLGKCPRGGIENQKIFWGYVCIVSSIQFETLKSLIQQSRMKQYADDTTMSLMRNDVSRLEEGLVSDLEGVTRWVEANKLKL